jgi:hypothetical protein
MSMPFNNNNMIIQRPSDFGSKTNMQAFLLSHQSNSHSSIIMGKPGYGKAVMYRTQMMKAQMFRPTSYPKSRLIAMGCNIEEKDGYIIGVDPDGDKFFTKNGLLHREGGPALERVNGLNKYALFGYLHNTAGPSSISELVVQLTTGEEILDEVYHLYGEPISKYDFNLFQTLCAEDIPTYISYLSLRLGVSKIEDVRELAAEFKEVPLGHLWKVAGVVDVDIPAGFDAIVQYEREQV